MTVFRRSAVFGVSGALLTMVFGIIHPKGTNDVGATAEWMSRVGASDVWPLVHLMLLVGAFLILFASAGISRSYPEEQAASWAHLGLLATVVATSAASITYLVDGPVLKGIADEWLAARTPIVEASADMITRLGFILVAGLQLSTGAVALLFGWAGLKTRAHPRWIGAVALSAGLLGLVGGAVHYLFGTSTASASVVYLSGGLYAIWVLSMSLRLWRARQPADPAYPMR